MHALIAGATGATGKDLLEQLLNDEAFEKVDIFVRRDPGIRHEKLKINIIDFDDPENWKHLITGDVLFSAIGTTLKAAGSKAAQWKIDHDYQYQFAKTAKENNVHTFVLVSSAMATPTARFFYPRMKGQLESAVTKLEFPKLIILRPPTLERKKSDRPMERVAVRLLRFFNRIGLLKSQQPMDTALLATAMRAMVKQLQNGCYVFEAVQIRNWVK